MLAYDICWVLLFVQKGPSDDVCYIRTVWFLWWTPHNQDPRGSRWQMMIGTVEAIRVSFQWRTDSSSLCWTQLYLLCVFMWTPYHHNLWRRRSFKFLRWNDEIFCVRKFQWLSSFRLRCLIPWWTPFHQDVKRIVAHNFGWHGVFLLAKRSQRWSVPHVHSVVLWYTLITMTLAGRLFRNLGCVSFILIAQFSSRSSCVRIVWSCGQPHTTVTESGSPRRLETDEGSVGLQTPVIISAFFALYGPVTNTLPLLFRE